MPSFDAAAFWQFSVGHYQQPQVKQLCLQLQDGHGINVNLLLLLCWLQKQRALLSRDDIKQLGHSISDSELRVTAHRQKRRAAKPQPELYKILLQEELLLEQQQQQLLIHNVNKHSFNSELETNNIEQYLMLAGVAAPVEVGQALSILCSWD